MKHILILFLSCGAFETDNIDLSKDFGACIDFTKDKFTCEDEILPGAPMDSNSCSFLFVQGSTCEEEKEKL